MVDLELKDRSLLRERALIVHAGKFTCQAFT